MSSNSAIQWTQATWNPVSGCTRVSAGCDNCYAVPMTHRLEAIGQTEKYGGLTVLNNRGDRHFNGIVKCHDDDLEIPLRRKKPTTYFVNSMSDLFHREVPFEFIDKVFAVMALCPQHTFQILTKRPERMAEYFDVEMLTKLSYRIRDLAHLKRVPIQDEVNFALPLSNVWLGTSVENQAAADERIPYLLRCPAAVRFLSCEPLLGPIHFDPLDVEEYPGVHLHPLTGEGRWDSDDSEATQENWQRIDWVIAGGESGAKARPCDIAWIRSIVKQCKVAGVPCFVKQLGKIIHVRNDSTYQGETVWVQTNDPKGGDINEWPEDLRVREFPKGATP